MFSIIRNTIENRKAAHSASSEIYPDLYLDRDRAIRRQNMKDICGIIGVLAMGAFAAFVWLAYEGWISPDMFK